jgi:hypothetical protein
MMRRTPLPELYKYLKQHYDYKKDVKKEINEETAQQVDSAVSQKQCSLQDIFQKRARTAGTDTPSVSNAVEEEEEYEIEEEIIQSPIKSIGKKRVETKVYDTQEDSIKRWLQSDDLPDDIEVACKTLIPLVYDDDEHVDPMKVMRRTPLPELFRYLKQNYKPLQPPTVDDTKTNPAIGDTPRNDKTTTEVVEGEDDTVSQSQIDDDNVEDILERSMKDDMGGSHQIFEESVRSYFDEVVVENGMSTRSFVEEEEEIIDESDSEEEHDEEFEEEVMYEEEEIVQPVRRGSL